MKTCGAWRRCTTYELVGKYKETWSSPICCGNLRAEWTTSKTVCPSCSGCICLGHWWLVLFAWFRVWFWISPILDTVISWFSSCWSKVIRSPCNPSQTWIKTNVQVIVWNYWRLIWMKIPNDGPSRCGFLLLQMHNLVLVVYQTRLEKQMEECDV